MTDKLPKCIGYVDGSDIILDEAPSDDPESYFNRKQRYSIKIQAVCDINCIFRNIFVGYPGSVHDARVYANSEIGRNPEKFLTNGQWIAGDSAYAVTDYLVAPFKRNSSSSLSKQKKSFNKYFSGYRVKIECAFGLLKETFGSLKGLRIRVDRKEGHKLACKWITACCILHNIIRSSTEETPCTYRPEGDDDQDDSDIESEEDEEESDSEFEYRNYKSERSANSAKDSKQNALFCFVIGKLGL